MEISVPHYELPEVNFIYFIKNTSATVYKITESEACLKKKTGHVKVSTEALSTMQRMRPQLKKFTKEERLKVIR